MNRTPTVVLAGWAGATLACASIAFAQDKPQSLRGDVPIEATSQANMFQQERDHGTIPRDFVQQPPLIPHSIRGYQVTKNFNKCMDCHAWSKAKQSGATKVSLTHFKDRSTGAELANISPARYFCLQCHVPQYDAKPLVENDFRPVDALAQPGAKK